MCIVTLKTPKFTAKHQLLMNLGEHTKFSKNDIPY